MKRLYISMNQTESCLYSGFFHFVTLARDIEAVVVGVFVIDRESLFKLERYRIFVGEEVSCLTESLRREGEKRNARLRRFCEEKGVEFSAVMIEGDPLHDFLRYVEEDACELKMIGVVRRGCGALFRDIFDPLSHQILLETPFHVFVVGVQSHERSH